MSEHDQQVAVVQWFRVAYPAHRIIAIPSGQWIAGKGKGKYGLIRKYKKEGWVNGVSDLLICVPAGKYAGMWLEMKDSNKDHRDLSTEQLAWLTDMESAGYFATWAAGFDMAKLHIEGYMDLLK